MLLGESYPLLGGKMKVRVLFADASYGPDQLKVLCKAFDAAWDQLAPNRGKDPDAVEAARMRLANIILGLSNKGMLDHDQLTNAALALMRVSNEGSPST